MILYEVLNERPDALAERSYAVWSDMEALLREHGVPQFTVDGHRSVRDFDVFGLSFSTELGYTNMLTALDLAGIPLHARDRGLEDPIVIAGGHAAFNPEPIADFIDAAIIGDGEQAVLEVTDLISDWKASGPTRRSRGAADAARPHRRRLRPGVLHGRLPARRPDPARRPGRARGPVARVQAHRHGPGRLALPQAAPRAAGRVRPRAHVGRDLPRLHPRLPVLPGGHDHPPGARALHHRHRRDGRARPGRHRLRGGRPALPLQRRPLRDRRHRQGPGRPLRRHPDRPVAALDPRGRVQHRPRQRADPRRPPLRPDVRPRGRVASGSAR